jgi:ribosomal protein S27E
MGNLKNYNFNKLDAFLSNSEYYDFYLAQDEGAEPCCLDGGLISGDCMVVHYDFNNNAIFEGGYPYNGIYGPQYGYGNSDSIYSLVSWTGATNTGYTFQTFGLTGIDNGYITFTKESGDTCNTALTSTLTSTTVVTSADTRLILTRVTGMTGTYEYPIEQIIDSGITGNYSRLCGGFYQGYYKLDGYSYEVLPVRVPKAWTAEFWLRKSDNACSATTATTLNDTYPNNKGFFFYMGTRAENKFWNVFEGNNTGCTSGCTADTGCTATTTTFCTKPKETDISFIDNDGHLVNLSPPPIEYRVITNPFLLYGRAGNQGKCGTCGSSTASGLGTVTTCNPVTSITISGFTQQTNQNAVNPFLIFGRAGNEGKCGACGSTVTGSTYGRTTVCNYSGDSTPLLELDKDADIIDNAIGFRIKDDGSIGYRALKMTGSCSGDTYVSGVTVEEQYSASGMVSDDEWHKIDIRFVMPEYDECDLKYGKARKGRLMFYVDCKLKFVAEEVDEFIAKRLNEHKDKQLGVPFNISLGGGSQGLLESMTFDGQDAEDLGLHIEQNFAGTFIGDVSQFKK